MLDHTRFGLVAAALLAFTAAQGCVIDDSEDVGDDDFRIINGDPATSDVPQYAATIGIHQRSGNQASISPFCSGTLVASDTVLTAAHCCDSANGGPSFKTMSPDSVWVYFGDGPAFVDSTPNGDFYAVSQVQIHPDYNRFALHNDICLMRLSTPNNGVAPVPPLPAAQGLSNADAGAVLDHAGFGYANYAKTEYGIKLHGEVPFGSMGCTVAGCPSGQPTDTQFSYVQTPGVPGPCNGDSGGPAFIVRSGVTYVAGVTSYGDADCDTYGVSTNVAAFEGWIGAFTGGGGGGGGDGGDGGGGDGGGATCGDGVCDAGESCDGRNGTTACGDCDGVTGGKPGNRYCYVGGTCEGPACP